MQGQPLFPPRRPTYLVTLKILSSRSALSTLMPKEVPGFTAAQMTSKMLPTITCKEEEQRWGQRSTACPPLISTFQKERAPVRARVCVCAQAQRAGAVGHHLKRRKRSPFLAALDSAVDTRTFMDSGCSEFLPHISWKQNPGLACWQKAKVEAVAHLGFPINSLVKAPFGETGLPSPIHTVPFSSTCPGKGGPDTADIWVSEQVCFVSV